MGNLPLAVRSSLGAHRFGVLTGPSAQAAPSSRSHLVKGRVAAMAMRPMLTELSRRTGQAGALDLLEHLLQVPTALRKTPYLVLVGLCEGVEPAHATADDLQGVVLVYEYRLGRIGSKVFSTDDISGQRTVIAPPGLRAQVAEAACRILAAHGALLSLITLEKAEEGDGLPDFISTPDQRGSAEIHLAFRTRVQPRDLLLQETLDATLATLGKHTRRNLRYYRRRAEADLHTSFAPSVEISREEFLEVNRNSTRPASEAEAVWRFEYLTSSPDRLFAGVRDSDGRWLSVIAGNRRGRLTQIEWQMNRADLPRYSLSTVMRSYLLEHEVSLGTERLVFLGGTPHSMAHSFESSETVDVIAVRRSFRAWLLRNFSQWLFPPLNFLGNALRDPELTWLS